MASDIVSIPELEPAIETQGIERVLPTTRSHVRIFDNFTIWMSSNLVIPTVAIGVLATSLFHLGFWDSVGAIVLFNVLGAVPVAFFSTMGPKLGLRQMTISRFSFGWVGAIIMALVNVAACTGWSAVNAIVGGQLVEALSGGTVARPVAILVIAVLTTIISIYGYKHVHGYARYAWIPIAIIFLIMLIIAGPKIAVIPTPAFGIAEIASFVASRVFWLTFLGVALPCIVLQIFGIALTTAYKSAGGGDLLVAVLKPLGGFGSFLLVLLALSIVANNVPNAYSLGLSMQVLGRSFQRVSRAIWTLFGALIYMLIAIPAVANFDTTLSNFLLIIAYWLGPWSVILLEEHFLFRRGRYNVEDWNTPGKLPIGWAALVSMAFGLVGVYLGAYHELLIGPIAKQLGMDIGFELGLIFAGIAYFFLRRIELALTGR